jgi:hypothetical protein
MASVATEVDKIISGITGGPVNDFHATLNDLNFNEAKLGDLTIQLNSFVGEKKPGASIDEDEISGETTVQEVIDLVSEQLD